MADIKPSIKTVEDALEKWKSDSEFEHYRKQEECLYYLFQKQFPLNENVNQILTKVTVLNDFYSTNIFYPLEVAESISKIQNIDWLLKSGSASVVEQIRKVVIDKSRRNSDSDVERDCYSFATKFCSFHNPTSYQIYDSNCYKVLNSVYSNSDKEELKALKKHIDSIYPSANNRTKFENACRCYPEFLRIVDCFTAAYGISGFSRKEIDRYLWITGKIIGEEK